jgi:hypothetical protein
MHYPMKNLSEMPGASEDQWAQYVDLVNIVMRGLASLPATVCLSRGIGGVPMMLLARLT